jgi:lon-related putative ATP-dependent protease
MDLLSDPSSVFRLVPAFYDRFGYGDRIYFETHLDATPENEIKIAQVIADEVYRFRMFPMEKDGILHILEYMREQAENNKKFKIMFRYVINAALQAFNLALLRGDTITRASDVKRAIEEFTDTLQAQAMKERLENSAPFSIIRTSGQEYGMVNGLSVLAIQGVDSRSAGKAFPVVAQVFPVPDPKYGDLVVTGDLKEEESWVQDSIKTVRTVIRKLYGKDIAKDYYTHISFAQQKDVEGPSAGAAMTLAIMSLLGDPRLPVKDQTPIPLRLDTAITGTIELIPDPHNPLNVRVGAIGGVPDKIQGAANAGCHHVIVPQENWEYTLTRQKYPCQVFGADSILAYFDLLRADGKGNMDSVLALQEPMTDEDVQLWAEKQAKRKGAA